MPPKKKAIPSVSVTPTKPIKVVPVIDPDVPIGFEKVELLDEISLEFHKLDANFAKWVEHSVFSVRAGSTTSDFGYIHKILSINKIFQARVPPNSLTAKIQVAYTAVRIRPIVGQLITLRITEFTPDGVYLTNEKVECLATNGKDLQEHKVGDYCECNVVCIRYSNGKIQCAVE
jgi:DNA-directed RNA polymerase subunit E'/Rpb7